MIEAPIDVTNERDGVGPSIHSLDRFVLQVPDLAIARHFFGRFGLDVGEQGDGLTIRTFGHDHVWGQIVEGRRKQTQHLSFGAYEEDMPVFAARLKQAGIAQVDAPKGFESNGLWFRGFDDILMEIRAAEKSSPDEPVAAIARERTLRGTKLGHQSVGLVRPSRLAHCLLFTSDVMGAIGFYRDVLGMRLSDRAGSIVAFMHGAHGSDHHMVAFAKSSAPGFHHSSWHVGNVEEVGEGAMLMAEAGFDKGWGLGRHVIGSNYFHYVQDPWGGFCEYSYDIDYIPRGHAWDSKDFPPADTLSLWGPPPPADFVHNYEAD